MNFTSQPQHARCQENKRWHGFSATSYTYDPNGNQLTVTDAAGHTTTSWYDPSDRVIEVDEPGAAGIVRQFSYYDGLGRKIQQTDKAGVDTDYSYDFRGLLTSVTLAAGTPQAATTVYTYDELGNELSQTDAANRTTTFQYDALGRRIGRTLPGGQSESFGYDLEGNQTCETNFNGVVITNQYDLGNRLLSQASVNGYNVGYAYSATGLRTNLVDRSGATVYLYDAMSRLTNKVVAWTNGPVRSLSYGYDAYGTLTNLYSGTYGGVSNAYTYDLLGRLVNVVANGNPGRQLRLRPAGQFAIHALRQRGDEPVSIRLAKPSDEPGVEIRRRHAGELCLYAGADGQPDGAGGNGQWHRPEL